MRSLSNGIRVVLIGAAVSFLHVGTVTADDLFHLFEFRSDSGRFRVGFPGMAPASRNLSTSKFTSTTHTVLHEVTIEETEFAVELHDIPQVAAMFLTHDFILDRAKAGMLEDIGARELASEEVSQQQQPARRVHYELPDRGLKGEALLVLAERRLYLVSAHHPRKLEPPVSFSTFLASFEFWLD